MSRAVALALLLALAGCGGKQAEMASDADSEAQAVTAAETLNDIAAAEAATRAPASHTIERSMAPPPPPATIPGTNVPVTQPLSLPDEGNASAEDGSVPTE